MPHWRTKPLTTTEYQLLEYGVRVFGPVTAPDPQTAWLTLRQQSSPSSEETTEQVLETRNWPAGEWHAVLAGSYGITQLGTFAGDSALLTHGRSYLVTPGAEAHMLLVASRDRHTHLGQLVYLPTGWTFLPAGPKRAPVSRPDVLIMAAWLEGMVQAWEHQVTATRELDRYFTGVERDD